MVDLFVVVVDDDDDVYRESNVGFLGVVYVKPLLCCKKVKKMKVGKGRGCGCGCGRKFGCFW